MAILSCMWAVGHRLDMLARASGDSENLSPAGCFAVPRVHFPGAVSASPGLFCFLMRHSCLLTCFYLFLASSLIYF